MLPRAISIGLSFDAFSVEVNVPMEGAWLADLHARNEVSRARDRGEVQPRLVYRDACPCCGSGMTALTAVDVPEGRVRACTLCGNAFSPGADG